ncbi:MAG: hypothetical protein ACRBB5_07005 [Nitrosopumilus sp.]
MPRSYLMTGFSNPAWCAVIAAFIGIGLDVYFSWKSNEPSK